MKKDLNKRLRELREVNEERFLKRFGIIKRKGVILEMMIHKPEALHPEVSRFKIYNDFMHRKKAKNER